MNVILIIIIAASLTYALGYRLGKIRGRLESRMREYRQGYLAGVSRSGEGLQNKLLPDDVTSSTDALETETSGLPGSVP